MRYSSISLKIKTFALVFAIFALSAYAGEGNMNFSGQLGIHKTQSAQTLGHGRFGSGLLMEGAGLGNIIEDESFYCREDNEKNCTVKDIYKIKSYMGLNVYPFLSIGLSDYFDFSIGIPLYGEFLTIKDSDLLYELHAGGWGDLFFSTKLRVPFNENFPLDIALLFRFSTPTGRKDEGLKNDYGPWVRDPMFLKILDDTSRFPIDAGNDKQSTYSNANPSMKLGLATTFDFGRLEASIPILLHLNGAYRWATGTTDYPNIASFSAATELTPVKFLSLFGEYYRDIALNGPVKEIKMNLSTATFGTSFHLGKTADLQLGVQMFIGDKSKYIDSLTVNTGDDNHPSSAYYNAKLIPDLMYYGGLTVKFFTTEPPKIEEVKEYRNPDTDADGVCDPWVAETGRQNEFSRVCIGIDLCVYEQGSMENKGCPVQETKVEAPTIIFTAMPDVVQKGQSVTLTWQVNNATKISIEGIGDVQSAGSKKLKPSENMVFTLTAVGAGGTQTATTDVEVVSGPRPIVLFSAAPESVQIGHPVTLNWQVTNATKVSIEGIGDVPLKGTKQVKPTENKTFALTAVGEGGTITEAVTIEVTPAPIIEARVNLTGVTFGSGNATLTANAKKILDGVAEQLLANPTVKIEIQGHTDNQGKPAANRDLSERRAKSVVAYLATKGVKMSRMRSAGYGQDIPIADNNTADGRELNRRIEMVRIDD
jgi:outer membrane protein OmpA-like peptidoglycan-associated protein